MKVILSTRATYPFHGYGGMQKYFFYLAKHLAREGIDVEILASLDDSGKRRVKYQGIDHTFISPNFKREWIGPLLFYPLYQYFNFNASQYLKHVDFDILHGCGGVGNYLSVKHRSPVIFQPFGSEPFKEKNYAMRILAYMMDYPFTRSTALHADAIASEGIAQSKEIMSLFGVTKEKIFILPDGVDLNEIKDFTKNAVLTKEDLRIHDADLTLINVNRLESNKGIPYLVKALRILNDEFDVRLIIVGTGSQERRIMYEVRSLGLADKVLFFKNIPDKEKFQLYNLADISVTPTLYEGLPIVILEAMACGKPVVASNVSDIPEVVKDGENGFLVKPANPESIAEKVLEIYDRNSLRSMGSKSKEIIRKYDWSRIARIAIRKYEELTSK